MLPEYEKEFQEELEMDELPSFDFKLNREAKTITGTVEEIQAIRQTIYMILNAERYQYEIYSWEYGVEFNDLYGEPVSYCCPEIERRITEALMMDERIMEVADFDFDYSNRRRVITTFTAHTEIGAIDVEKVVKI